MNLSWRLFCANGRRRMHAYTLRNVITHLLSFSLSPFMVCVRSIRFICMTNVNYRSDPGGFRFNFVLETLQPLSKLDMIHHQTK